MKFDTDFRGLIPPLSKEEYALLSKSIRKDGCRDNIVVWTEKLSSGEPGRTMILDGHNRHRICKENKIDFGVTYLLLKDRGEAKIWVIQNQLGRRNLTHYQRGKLTLQLKSMLQEKAKEKQIEGGKTKLPQISAEPPIDTRQELAKLAGVSHDTIYKVEVIEKEASPEVKEAAEKGEISINKAYKETRPKKKTIDRTLYSGLTFEAKETLFKLKRNWEEANKKVKNLFAEFIHERGESNLFTKK